MQRSLQSFPLSSGQQTRLRAAGFETADDLATVSVVELSKELSIPNTEALAILNVVTSKNDEAVSPIHSPNTHSMASPVIVGDSRSHSNITGGQSALELLRVEQEQPFIVTFSSKVDEMLGGGIPVGKVTELCGAPGIGKTQFSMQLAVDVGIPEAFGGMEGETIYIDTEGSFIVERVVEIASAAVQHISSLAKVEDCESSKEFTVDKVLAGIHYYRCHDYIELVALVNILPQIISRNAKVKLVVIDSVACPFRHGFDDMGMRNRILSGMAQNLIKLATLDNVAVVLTNQMTTRPHSQNPSSARLVPALGESWGHACTIRVVIYWKESHRYAMLYKSPTRRETVVPFCVTHEGVRDSVEELSQDSQLLREWGETLSSSQLDEMENSESIFDNSEQCSKEPGNSVTKLSRKRTHPES